ncbi:hypothetical protein AAMO2058_001728200 [Amorphochlora amoebiformis]
MGPCLRGCRRFRSRRNCTRFGEHIGRKHLSSDAKLRVVSLLPSATEIFALIEEEVIPAGMEYRGAMVGRSHECDYPSYLSHLPTLTTQAIHGTGDSVEIDKMVREALTTSDSLYGLYTEELKRLNPTVILTQDLCNVCSIDLKSVELSVKDMHPKPKIVSLNPYSIQEVRVRVRVRVGLSKPANIAFEKLETRFNELKSGVIGHRNSSKSQEVSPCGFDIKATLNDWHRMETAEWWKGLRAVREKRAVIVDGNQHFNRPSPRLLDALSFLIGWLNDDTELIPEGFPFVQVPT